MSLGGEAQLRVCANLNLMTWRVKGLKCTQRRPNALDVGPTLYKCYTNGFNLLDKTSVALHFVAPLR